MSRSEQEDVWKAVEEMRRGDKGPKLKWGSKEKRIKTVDYDDPDGETLEFANEDLAHSGSSSGLAHQRVAP